MGRRAPRLLSGLVAAALLGGCGSPVAEYPTAIDFERAAERIWSDPWLAPDTATVAGTIYGGPDGVDRRAGTRTTYDRSGAPEALLAREVRAAESAGWRLLGAACDDDPRAVLSKGDGLDDGALATVETRTLSEGVNVLVTGLVPHHLDGDWPSPAEPVDLTATCLAGGDGPALPEVPELGPPLAGDGAVDTDVEGPARWRRTALDGAEERLVSSVAADPWIRSIGAQVVAPSDLRAEDARRSGFGAEGTVGSNADDPGRAIDEVVATMTGWELTWATCGAGRPTEATLRLTTPAGLAAVRLTARGDGAVEWRLRLPVPETPTPRWLAEVPVLAESTCLDGRADAEIRNEGRPVVVAGESQPVVGR